MKESGASMKKSLRKLISLFMALCLMSTAVAAADLYEQSGNEIMPRYTYIQSIATGLGISTSGKASCYTSITLYNYTHSCKVNMVLQRNDGTGWDDVRSWTLTDDGVNIDIIGEWYVAPGYDYQVESTMYVYNANGRLIETTTTYSPIKYY